MQRRSLTVALPSGLAYQAIDFAERYAPVLQSWATPRFQIYQSHVWFTGLVGFLIWNAEQPYWEAHVQLYLPEVEYLFIPVPRDALPRHMQLEDILVDGIRKFARFVISVLKVVPGMSLYLKSLYWMAGRISLLIDRSDVLMEALAYCQEAQLGGRCQQIAFANSASGSEATEGLTRSADVQFAYIGTAELSNK